MASDGRGTIYIPFEDWFKFVSKYGPDFAEAEVRYSLPKYGDGEIAVDYAYSTECAPETWADCPEWLKGERE